MTAPDIGGHLSIRFSDDATRERYFAQSSLPKDNQVNEEAAHAWSIIRGFAKIEQGIDRLIVACLVGVDAYPDRRLLLSSVFTFDERLRVVERLIKVGALTIGEAFRQIDGPAALQGPLDPIEAIRNTMGYRNRLVHEGIFMWIAGNAAGYQTSIWVDGPSGQASAVPLVRQIDGQPSLFDFVGRLAMALPVYFGPPMFIPDSDKTLDAHQVLNHAMAKSSVSHQKAAERRAEAFDQLLAAFRVG